MRKRCPFLKLDKPEDIKGVYTFERMDNGLIKINVSNKYGSGKFNDIRIYINVTDKPINLEFEDYQNVLISLDKPNPTLKIVVINAAKMNILYKV